MAKMLITRFVVGHRHSRWNRDSSLCLRWNDRFALWLMPEPWMPGEIAIRISVSSSGESQWVNCINPWTGRGRCVISSCQGHGPEKQRAYASSWPRWGGAGFSGESIDGDQTRRSRTGLAEAADGKVAGKSSLEGEQDLEKEDDLGSDYQGRMTQ